MATGGMLGANCTMDVSNIAAQESPKTVSSVDVGVGGVWSIAQVVVQDEPVETNISEYVWEDAPARLPHFVRAQRRAFRHRPAGCATTRCQDCRPTGRANRFEAFREDEEDQESQDKPATAETDFP